MEKALKFEPILNKKFLNIWMGTTKIFGDMNQFFWIGYGTYAKKHVDRPRYVLKTLGDCE